MNEGGPRTRQVVQVNSCEACARRGTSSHSLLCSVCTLYVAPHLLQHSCPFSLSLSTSLLITYLSLPGWRLSLHVEFTRVQSIADSCDDWLGLSYMRPQLCFADVILSTQDQTRECHLAEGQKSRTSEHSSLAYLRPHLHVCLHTLMCESILERVVTSS